MTPTEAKSLIGKRVRWVMVTDPYRITGKHYRHGTVDDVKYKNVLIDGQWRWLPDLVELEMIE